MSRTLRIVVILVLISMFALATLHVLGDWGDHEVHDVLTQSAGNKRLAVLVHGLGGRELFEPAVSLTREALPDSDLLIFHYPAGVLSNVSPYAITNSIERRIHEVYNEHQYEEIIVIGHSMGGMLLRKAIVWANGYEQDRRNFGQRGQREWVKRVSRFISLASTNRGWSLDPRPTNMTLTTFILFWTGERLGTLSGSGQLVLGLRRGSPFVADARIQWIEMCRSASSTPSHVPQTIHLLGDRDDIVSRDDSIDLVSAQNTIFVSLRDTGHLEIASALQGGNKEADHQRREKVRLAIKGDLNLLDRDKPETLSKDMTVERITYVMHGIRDYGEWTDRLRQIIETQSRQQGLNLVVVNQKYGRFPMLPFLLYWDRQKNVRRFMDEYTENYARFPRSEIVDFVGHSNGTYILASALQRYATLQVKRVYFAGSVVPKHYPWRELADRGRVEHVVNVVAAGDWVVAIFPRFFEQIADWMDIQPTKGLLDIGSGGFRGFQEAMDAKGRIENVQFAEGAHSTGIDPEDPRKLHAIANYIMFGNGSELDVFRNVYAPYAWLDTLSNLSWLVWLVLALVLTLCCLLAFRMARWVGLSFLTLVLALLYSV